MADTDQSSLSAWLDAHPHISRVEAFVFDLMGAAKGKWLERGKAGAVDAKGLPIPISVFALDAWGCDVAGAGLAFGTGDPDALCYPVAGRFAEMPWGWAGHWSVLYHDARGPMASLSFPTRAARWSGCWGAMPPRG